MLKNIENVMYAAVKAILRRITQKICESRNKNSGIRLRIIEERSKAALPSKHFHITVGAISITLGRFLHYLF